MQRVVTKAMIIMLATVIFCGGQQVLAQNVNICDDAAQISRNECEALVALYNSTNGDQWKNNKNWLVTMSPCEWHGVNCEQDEYVKSLLLSKNNLKGTIPAELGDLAGLTFLDLSHNSLSGNLPPEIGNLGQLKYLNLSNNRVSGDVQSLLASLTALTHLDLSTNQFQEQLPFTLKKLKNLEYLDLSRNRFSGTMFNGLGTLSNLKHFNLSSNRLTGRIHPDISGLSQLNFLDLSGNDFCRPFGNTFSTWLDQREYAGVDYPFCTRDIWRFYLSWLSVFLLILAAAVGITGIMMGMYGSLKHVYGTAYGHLFGYSIKDNGEMRMTGVLNRAVLNGGLFSIMGGIGSLLLITHQKVPESFVVVGFLIGTAAGVIYSHKERIRASGKGKVAIGFLTGITAGGLLALLAAERIGWTAANIIAAAMTGMGAGGIAGMFSVVSKRMTMNKWFPGNIIGGIAGGFAGYATYAYFSHWDFFPLTSNSTLSEGLLTGGIGICTGALLGMCIGLFLGVVAVILTRLISFIIRTMNGITTAILIPSLTVARFNTIICNHCLRYTEPLKSRYDEGKRSCEHCGHEVEFTPETGLVRLVFGSDPPPKAEGRVFELVNPDFERKKQPIDLSEVYIDTDTTDQRLLERFLTYIINHPPEKGLESVRIVHQGELDDLGDNLTNALRNTFTQIE